MDEQKMNVSLHLDMSEVEAMTEKVERLNRLLREAKSLIYDLANSNHSYKCASGARSSAYDCAAASANAAAKSASCASGSTVIVTPNETRLNIQG